MKLCFLKSKKKNYQKIALQKFIKKKLFLKYFYVIYKYKNNNKIMKIKKKFFTLKYFFGYFKKTIFLKFEKYNVLNFALNYYLNFFLKQKFKYLRKLLNNSQLSKKNLIIAKNYYLIRKIKFFFINLKALIKLNFKKVKIFIN